MGAGTIVSVIDGIIRNLGYINHEQYSYVGLEVINEETGERKTQHFSVAYLTLLNDPNNDPDEMRSVQPHHPSFRRRDNHNGDVQPFSALENSRLKHDPLRDEIVTEETILQNNDCCYVCGDDSANRDECSFCPRSFCRRHHKPKIKRYETLPDQ